MSESAHLKCPCQHCGSSIEFPAHGVGASIDCPHCSGKTTLFAPSADPQQAEIEVAEPEALPPEVISPGQPAHGGRRGSKVWMALVGIAVAAGVAGFFAFRKKPMASHAADNATSTAVPSIAPETSSLPPSPTNVPAAAKAAKSVDDLKVGPIKLEKAKGSSLVYAVGAMRNASDLQRFGVTVELELTDAGGRKVGTAKDYRNVLEPRQEWRFRALVLDSKAVSASVARIREEE
jgi:hypothetical protein